MENYRELLKQDIITITKLCQDTDYEEAAGVKRSYQKLLEEPVFHTDFGSRYTERLGLIADGKEFVHTCILCKRDTGSLPVICAKCLENIPVNQGISIKETDLEPQPGQQEADAGSKFGYGDKKWIIAIVFLCAVILSFLMGRYSNRAVYQEKKPIHNAREAFALVEQYYAQEEYNITFEENSECPSAVFLNTAGDEPRQEDREETEMLPVFVFGVVKKDFTQAGQVWVAEDGSIAQAGWDGGEHIRVIR